MQEKLQKVGDIVSLRSILKQIWYKRIKKWDSAQIRLDHLRRCGMSIGEKTCIFSDDLETSESYLCSIGNNVMIASGVRFTTHDASACYYLPGASDIFGRITISDDCFLGMGSIILPGVFLAKGCIVAAGSVVTKSFEEPGSVIAGNPARKICTIEDLKKRNEKYTLNTWGMGFEEKRAYLLANEDKFKGYKRE